MEWTNRNSDNSATPAQTATAPAPGSRHRAPKNQGMFMGLRLATVALLFSVTILIVALAWFVAIGGPNNSESKYIDKNHMQAVFLNGGQVYFGKITNLNDRYMRVEDIYYLRVNQQVQPNQENGQQQQSANDISLVKLGCELHGPDDNMLINREQIIFWENLKDDGQVAKAVADYKQKNPDGQKCESPSATTPPTTPTPTTTTPTPPTTPTTRR